MNRAEITIVALLVLLLIAWGYFQRTLHGPAHCRPNATRSDKVSQDSRVVRPASPETGPAAPAVQAARQESPAETPLLAEEDRPETRAVLSNGVLTVTLSSRGAAIVDVTLHEYRAGVNKESGPMRLDFSEGPALALSGFTAGSHAAVFDLQSDGRIAQAEREVAPGVRFIRTVELREAYEVRVIDRIINESDRPYSLPSLSVALGAMTETAPPQAGGLSYLGLDTRPDVAGEGVRHWLRSAFLRKSPVLTQFTYQRTNGAMPLQVLYRTGMPIVWGAAKNKFFVQILVPDSPAVDCELAATRDPAAGRRLVLASVRAALIMSGKDVEAGAVFERHLDYYVGPKKYAILKNRPAQQDEVMEFGRWFGWLCKLLLPALNAIYAVTRNYGVAIIILTALMRVVLYPVTRRSTLSMKKMQALQPLVEQIRAKYKGQPQKMNQELMALYRQHKVNPMAGCLPILVQIPVFFALFTVLRSAVELRFAPFIPGWIDDLSEPEGLLNGWLNILPILMTAATIYQQHLTPSAGDPQQRRMMMIMPIVMLFIFYKMASALVLYWTASTCLGILEMWWQRRHSDKTGKAVENAKVPTPTRTSDRR